MVTVMNDELFRAAVEGEVGELSEENIAKNGDEYYQDQTTPRKNNIIHIAAEHGRARFIQVALARFYELGCRRNDNGDTPLHVASRKGNDEIVRLLVSLGGSDAIATQNLQGDTPLHLALGNNKLRVAKFLLDQVGSDAILSLVNTSQETPLHVFLKYCIGTHTTADALLEEGVLNLQGVYKSKCQMSTHRSVSSSNMIEGVLTKLLECEWVACMRDAKGLTPLLIAAQRGSFLALKHILEHCSQSAEVCDLMGKTVLHHLKSRIIIPLKRKLYARDHDRDSDHNQRSEEPKTAQELQSICYRELKELFKIPEIDAIKDAKDSDGNTPVYGALQNEDFVLIKVLFECFADFTIKNKDGDSALDLIQSIPDFATKMVHCDYFFDRTSQGLSILHVAVKHGRQSFVEEAIKLFPTLVLIADLSGETPLNVAARLNKDHYPVAATLLQLAKDCINKFKEEKQLKDLASLAQRKVKEEAFGKKMMEKEVYTEAVNGNMDYFFKEKLEEQNQDNTFMCQVAPDGSNILHIAIQHNRAEFAMKVMECYPHLIWERDYHGDTPLHTAAKHWAMDYSRLLPHSHFKAQWKKACRSYHDSPSEEGLLIIPPWRVKNSQGNVPLHEKVDSPRINAFGLHLLRFDFEAAAYVNSVGDTPLHISAKELYSFFSLIDWDNNARSAACVRDKEGLTPLLRAAKAGNYFKISLILESFPKLVQVRDDRGRSLLHLLRVTEDEYSQNSAKKLYNKVSTLDGLQKTKDFDGNTPLHSPIQDSNSIGAKLIAERYFEVEDITMARCQLAILNNDGKSIMDLLASHDDAPTEVQT
ncbi:hypothetical protein Cgig2_002891 [Carnegiea gigantea]|uniref:Uncharacterized protein n=1 Tax=Carnegiea gigantea TaxID=171969 RepID=A0A9Q1QM06_9CARY|nr:hypothetical protein Cgig2_002891 [Carnegiea gigantea]